MLEACAFFHLIRYKRLENGYFAEVQNSKYLYIHYLVITLQLFHFACKVYVLLLQLIFAPLGVEVFVCICNSLIYIVAVSCYLVTAVKYREIVDTLNSWPQFLPCLRRNTEERELTVFDSKSSSLKVLMLGGVVLGCSAAVAMGGLAFNRLPVFIVNMLDRFGMIPSGIMPYWILWLILFMPIEFLVCFVTVVGPMYPIAVMLLSFDSFKIFIEQLRSRELRTVVQRKQMEKKMISMQVIHRILLSWETIFMPVLLIGVSSALTVLLFLSIRFTDIPFYFYIFFPFVGFSILAMIFWVSYDIVKLLRAADDLLGKFTSVAMPHLEPLPRAEKGMKRAKAMKPLDLPVGNFTDFSLTGPMNIWEEVLNQLLFLLSL